MRSYTAILLIATLVSAMLIGPVRSIAQRLGAVSVPGGRHVHQAATPRLGGVAIFFGVLVPLAVLFNIDAGAAQALRADAMKAAGLVIGAVIMCGVGSIDDVRGMRALYKLLFQVAAATVAWLTGFRIEGVHLPIIGDLSMGIFSYPVSTLWIVGIINAINLIDGLDGLAAGVAIFAALTNFVVAYLADSTLVALVMIALLGATLGFLFHNFNPARIFMGDSGSYFIGYVLATCAIIGTYQKASTTVSILVPVLALGVPILDTLFAIVRRFLERRPLFSPDRGHIHHRLLDMGLTHRRVVLIIYGVSVAFTASGIAIALGRRWQVGVALLSATVVLVALIRFVGYVEQINQSVRSRRGFRTAEVERQRRAVADEIVGLDSVKSEEELFVALQRLLTKAGVALFEISMGEPPNDGVVQTIELVPEASRPRELAVATFTLGEAHSAVASVRYYWSSELGTGNPASDILFQLVTDVCARSLQRLGSTFVAQPAKVVTDRPSNLGVPESVPTGA